MLLSPAFVMCTHYTVKLLITFHIANMLSNSVEGHALKKMRANNPENNALICDYACIPNFYPPPPPWHPKYAAQVSSYKKSSQSALVSPRGVTCFLFYT
jgi:hypothetical protein